MQSRWNVLLKAREFLGLVLSGEGGRKEEEEEKMPSKFTR